MEPQIVEELFFNETWSIEECIRQGINISFDPEFVYELENSTNVKCYGHQPELTQDKIIQVIVLCLIAVASFVGNVWTIVSIKKSQRTRRFSRTSCSAIYTLILHLSIADLVVTVFCLFGEAAWTYAVAWLAGNICCKFFKFFQMFGLYLSTYVMVLIGVDRFIAVKYPMKNLSNSKNETRFLIITYAISAVLSIPQIMVFHVMKGPFIEEFYQCVTHGMYTSPWQEKLYTSLSLLFMFIIPLIILLWTYAATFKTIAESEKTFKADVADGGRRADLNRRKLIHRAKMKSLRLSVVIVVTFVIWWMPYYIMMLICIFVDTTAHVSESLHMYIFFFGMSNSVMNPIIYGAFQMYPDKKRNQSFRDGSVMNYRSTVTQASVRRNSTRIITDRPPRVLHEESIIEEETNLMSKEKDHDQLSPGSFKIQTTNGYSSIKNPNCRKVTMAVNGEHVNNGTVNTNGDVAKL